MSSSSYAFSKLEGFNRPLIFRIGWPEPVSFSESALRAVLFDCMADKKNICDALVVNRDQKFLQLESFDEAVRLTSGNFTGEGSRISSVVVRCDDFGTPIPPKQGIRRWLPGKNNDVICSWQEALAVSLHFVGHCPMPSGLAWWEKSAA